MVVWTLEAIIRRLDSMWTVIYIAPTAKIAERIKQKLTEEGFLVKIRAINLTKNQFEILVPAGELEEVQEVLNSILHR
jgi:ribosomal protein S8